MTKDAKNLIVGLDIGTSKVVAVVAEVLPNGRHEVIGLGQHESKGLKKGELLDRAGSTELAANLFRVTQTTEKLKNDNVHGIADANSVHFTVGLKVRKALEDTGYTLPENIPVVEDISLEGKKDKELKFRKNSKRRTVH